MQALFLFKKGNIMTNDDACLREYLKEVYYFDPDDAVEDVFRLLDGTITIDQLRKEINDGKVSDEKEFGNDIYIKEQYEV